MSDETGCRVTTGWTRDGKPSAEGDADDWHLIIQQLGGEVEVTYRLYGVYHRAEPPEWEAFLSEGAPETASICYGELRRDRARQRLVLSLSVEGTDIDALMVATVPEGQAIAGLRAEIRHLVAAGRYYPRGRWASEAAGDL